MALYTDLIEQARHLAFRERKKPKQASLRRAVSAAYYAIFHLLVDEGVQILAPREPATLRGQVRRAFAHSEMKNVCAQFAKGNIAGLGAGTREIVTSPIRQELQSVATAFVALQQERNRADYDLSQPFVRADVLQKVNQAQQAITDWQAVRKQPNSAVFLAALLLQKHWNK